MKRRHPVTAVLIGGIVLGGCGGGGGGDASNCASGIAGLCAALGSSQQVPPGGAGGESLFTTAPSQLSMAVGANASYAISGGSGAYMATSSDPRILKASVNGNSLVLEGLASGSATVQVTDSAGRKLTLAASVTNSLGDALFTTAPGQVTMPVGVGSSYTIGGGSGPYTATSSNTSVLKAIANGNTLLLESLASGTATVQLTDSAGHKVSIEATLTSPLDGIALYTTAPTVVTLPSGGSASYTIGGGTPPYTVSSGNPAVVTASASGAALTINAIWQQSAASAPTQLAIVDARGQRLTTGVTVLGKGQTGVPPSIYPASITVSDCTTNIPFVFSGGTPPFTVYTGDSARAPVSAPLPLGPDSYFTANTHIETGGFFREDAVPTSERPYLVTLTVLDSQSRSATADLLIGSQFHCADVGKLDVKAGSNVAKVGETSRFYISGGTPPYSATSGNPAVALAGDDQAGAGATHFIDVKAISTGGQPIGYALITVTSADGQKQNVVLSVYPQP